MTKNDIKVIKKNGKFTKEIPYEPPKIENQKK
jgi:hypothetical protein